MRKTVSHGFFGEHWFTLAVFHFQTLLQEVRHKEVNASKHNEFLNAKLRDVSIIKRYFRLMLNYAPFYWMYA